MPAGRPRGPARLAVRSRLRGGGRLAAVSRRAEGFFSGTVQGGSVLVPLSPSAPISPTLGSGLRTAPRRRLRLSPRRTPRSDSAAGGKRRRALPVLAGASPSPTDPWEALVPDGPHLDGEEGRPADDVRRDDDEGHLDGADLGARDGLDAADTGGEQQPPPRAATARPPPAARCHLPRARLASDVAPDVVADEAVAGDEDEDGRDEDAAGDPGDVGSGPPGHDEVRPAVVYLRAALYLAEGEDEVLRGAEQQAERPGRRDHPVGALGGLLQRLQRVADGDVAVGGHGHQHVRRREHAEDLQVLDDATEPVGAVEAVGHLPAELGQHLEEGHHQVGEAEVPDEEVHAGRLAGRAPQGQQHAAVAHHRHGEGDRQHGDLQLRQLLVPPERVPAVQAAVGRPRPRLGAGAAAAAGLRLPPPAAVPGRGRRPGGACAAGEAHGGGCAAGPGPVRPGPTSARPLGRRRRLPVPAAQSAGPGAFIPRRGRRGEGGAPVPVAAQRLTPAPSFPRRPPPPRPRPPAPASAGRLVPLRPRRGAPRRRTGAAPTRKSAAPRGNGARHPFPASAGPGGSGKGQGAAGRAGLEETLHQESSLTVS